MNSILGVWCISVCLSVRHLMMNWHFLLGFSSLEMVCHDQHEQHYGCVVYPSVSPSVCPSLDNKLTLSIGVFLPGDGKSRPAKYFGCVVYSPVRLSVRHLMINWHFLLAFSSFGDANVTSSMMSVLGVRSICPFVCPPVRNLIINWSLAHSRKSH